jgi:hypothetical protein
MRRSLLLIIVLSFVVIGCSGPPEATDQAALFTDLDLDNATAIATVAELGVTAGDHTLDAAGLVSNPISGSRTLAAASVDALGPGKSSPTFSVGGYLVYVEHTGANYSIRLAKLDQNSEPDNHDKVIYQGKKPIQSVAVSGDGTVVAFVAAGANDNNDVYVLDVKRKKVSATTTAAAESDISMSLDGRYLSWQGETANGKSLVWFENGVGGVQLDPATFAALYGRSLTISQPSLSGNGMSVALVETSGNLAALVGQAPSPALGVLTFIPSGSQISLNLSVLYLGQVSEPSLDYDATNVLFKELFGGVTYLSVIDRSVPRLYDVLVANVEHPYITADGGFLTFSFGGDAYVGTLTGEIGSLSPSARTTDSATYWARGNFTAYEGSNTQGPFVRPDDGGGLDAAGRTVGYHVYEFRPPVTDYYEILSVQDYDGYLTLYEKNFNPRRSDRNVVANNDDYQGGWDDEVGVARSRIVAQLKQNTTYYIVTSACGAPGTPCGPATGAFNNLITGGAEPPTPPTQLPEPDDSRFNITLRFWDDSLTEDEQAIFAAAAERWSEVISGDLENIQNFFLSEDQTTNGAPGLIGELDDVIIDAAKVPIDAPGGTLARAGAFYVRNGGSDDFLPTYGIMEFDSNDFGPGQFFEDPAALSAVILHEMAHVLGISRAFWNPLGLIEGNPVDADGNPTGACSDVADPVFNDPRYLGTAGNAAWVGTYGATTNTVPIANTNGCGTADSHWREIYLVDEIMTGFAQGGGEPISEVTIGAFQDLGYTVDMSAADAWSIPALPTLSQVAPNPTQYSIEFDFTSAFTGSMPGDVTAPVTAVDLQLGLGNASTSGCEAADFAGFPAGNIALLQRGTCAFGIKAQNALAAGASAVLIGNQGDTEARKVPSPATFGDPVGIVGVPISYDVMVELASTPGAVVRVDTDISDNLVFGPQALPRINWHLAEEYVPLRGSIARDGTVTNFGD